MKTTIIALLLLAGFGIGTAGAQIHHHRKVIVHHRHHKVVVVHHHR